MRAEPLGGARSHGRGGAARQTLPPPSLRCPTAGPSSRSRCGVVTARSAGCPPGSPWAGAAGGTLSPPCPPRSQAGRWRRLWPGPRAGCQRAHLHTRGSRLTQGFLPAWWLGPTGKRAPQDQDCAECPLVGRTLLSISGAHNHPLGEETRQRTNKCLLGMQYADDTMLMAGSKKLKRLLVRVKEESESVSLKLNVKKD